MASSGFPTPFAINNVKGIPGPAGPPGSTGAAGPGQGIDCTTKGCVGDGTTDCTAGFALAATAASSDPSRTVYVPAGAYKLASTQTLTANLKFAPGAMIKPAAGQTVTISGQIQADDYQQIFDTSLGGTILLPNVPETNACHFGADPTQNNDSLAAIQAALSAAKTSTALSFGNLTKYARVPAGIYKVSAPITNTLANCRLRGDGAASTQIWAYGICSPCVHYSNLTTMTLNANDYAGGNSANLGDGPVLALHRFGPSWYLDGKAQFSLDCIFQARTTPQTQSTVLIASRGIDPDFNTGRNAFYLFLLAADNGYSNTNMALQWVLHTSGGTVTAQTNAGCIVPGTAYYNVRLDYDGAYMRIFVNGVAQTLTNADTKIAQTGTIVQHYAEGVSLGLGLTANFWGTDHVYSAPQGGRVASLRLKWVSQGSANYSPPVAKFTEDADTKFLINFDTTGPGGMHFARAYGGTLFGNVDAWIPNEDGSDVTKQISYNTVEDITLVADNGPAVNLNACPNVLVTRCNLYGQGGVYVNENSYNSTIEKNNMFCLRDRSNGGGKGIGIWSAAASNYLTVRDNVISGFDVCFFSGQSFCTEGYNYFVQPKYAGIYLENSYAGSIGGNPFISDEGSAFDNPYGLVLAGVGCVKVSGALFGIAAHTDQVQILINNSSGSPTPKSHIVIEGVNLTSGVGQTASIQVTHTRAGDELIIAGCAPGVNSIPLLAIDSTTLGRILVQPSESSSIAITMTDANYTPSADEWHYGKLVFSGTLTADRDIVVPTIAGYRREIQNLTAHALLVKTASGTGTYVPPGLSAGVSCDGTNVVLDWLEGVPVQLINSGTSSTASAWAQVVGVNVGTAYNLTGPTGTTEGQTFVVKDNSGAAGTNNITLTAPSGQTYDGAATATIATNYGRVSLMYDGVSNWMS